MRDGHGFHGGTGDRGLAAGGAARGWASESGDGKLRAVELLIAVKPDPDSGLSRETVPDISARYGGSHTR